LPVKANLFIQFLSPADSSFDATHPPKPLSNAPDDGRSCGLMYNAESCMVSEDDKSLPITRIVGELANIFLL
ncbi:hypothetical protein AB205_0035160, partial [Aquarana catesbeiana]